VIPAIPRNRPNIAKIEFSGKSAIQFGASTKYDSVTGSSGLWTLRRQDSQDPCWKGRHTPRRYRLSFCLAGQSASAV